MKTSPLTALLCVGLAACQTPQQASDEALRKAMAPHKAKICAMSEPERRAWIIKRLEKANASGGYVRGKYYDTTVVLSSEIGSERYYLKKATGC